MKYILYLQEIEGAEMECVHIFSNFLTHKTEAERMSVKPIRAGFVKLRCGEIVCYGESESLGIKSHKDDCQFITL